MTNTEQTTALRSALGWTFDRARTVTPVVGPFAGRVHLERMLKRGAGRRVAVVQIELTK